VSEPEVAPWTSRFRRGADRDGYKPEQAKHAVEAVADWVKASGRDGGQIAA